LRNLSILPYLYTLVINMSNIAFIPRTVPCFICVILLDCLVVKYNLLFSFVMNYNMKRIVFASSINYGDSIKVYQRAIPVILSKTLQSPVRKRFFCLRVWMLKTSFSFGSLSIFLEEKVSPAAFIQIMVFNFQSIE